MTDEERAAALAATYFDHPCAAVWCLCEKQATCDDPFGRVWCAEHYESVGRFVPGYRKPSERGGDSWENDAAEFEARLSAELP